ncbi:MAG: hypothetical protein U0841_02580 [Chloroflexia bacterium]
MPNLSQRIAELKKQIERERFAGGDPIIELPANLAPAEIAARTLAAERAHALLALDNTPQNPAEDLADAALRGAIGALRAWGFAAARARLDEAAERSHDPATQQRITLFKQLTRHTSAIVYTRLDEKLRLTLADLDEATRPLDLLDPTERLHYRDEIDRLLALREAATKGDPFLAVAWKLLRAQVAMSAGQDEAAQLWLLHLATDHPIPPTDTYLADLVTRTRSTLATMIGLPDPAPTDDPRKADPIRPRELFNALVARLTADLGRDAVQGMNQFTITEWIAPDMADERSEASAAKRPPRQRK